MLTAKEIKDKTERSYKDFLLSVLRRDAFFPFHIKGNKGSAHQPLQDLFPALKHLIDNSKEKLGYGYALTYKEVNTRHSGVMTMPDAVFFENPQDYLKFIDKEQAFLSFRKAVELTKRQTPTLLKWIEDNVLKCQKHANDWADILKIVTYFTQNPKPNVYWRQLPIAVDLVAMEIHQALIAELLEMILPPNAINHNETAFEPRFGLKYDEAIVRLRFSNDLDIPLSIGRDFALPFSVIADWMDIQCHNIFFITDKNIFLSFPNTPLSILVLWEHPIAVLSKIKWFQDKNTYFISDISPKGFEQISEMRSILRGLKSLMMDKTTFESFTQHQQTQKITATNPFLTHLTNEEQAFYQFLLSLKEKNSLLQRDIPYAYLIQEVLKL